MYIFSGNATIFEKTFNSGHFWVAQNDSGGRTLGRRQQDLGTLWLSGRLDVWTTESLEREMTKSLCFVTLSTPGRFTKLEWSGVE